MFTVDELSRKIADYRSGRISLEQFDNWFEDNSIGAYAAPDLDLRQAYAAVEAAFARYYFDHIGEHEMKAELANAIRPFAWSAESAGVEFHVSRQWLVETAELVETAGLVEMVPVGEGRHPSAPGEDLAPTKNLLIDGPSGDTVSTTRTLQPCVQLV